MTVPRSIVVHGHFYQPPRENPWLEEVEAEPSAAPFHDWNARIERECYRAVVAARVLAGDGRIARIVNALEHMSFNFGPTLLEWMERAAPDTYAQVLDADRRSVARLGHGNAIAQPYHHAILPLSTRRDKRTEVRWGIADFRRRFGRDPEGMWLPETAVDDETLDVLAEEGIRFTILAPSQVVTPPPAGMPGRYLTAHGREIALFIYDGALSHDVAFGSLVRDGRTWVQRCLAGPEKGASPRLVSMATDGETYGHHHKFGEMALAFTLETLRTTRGVVVENFASYLAREGAEVPVALVEPTSWSCAHGVERWRSDCGCRMKEWTQQRWRAPLRAAITTLAEGLATVYEREAATVFADPWASRDAFGAVVGAAPAEIEAFAAAHVRGGATRRALELLELARGSLRIFTSCAWFFDDIAGIEPVQVLRYCARAIELAGPDGPALERALVATLAAAESNDRGEGTGDAIWHRHAVPTFPPALRVAGSVGAAFTVAPDDPRAGRASPALEIVVHAPRVWVRERRIGRETAALVQVEHADSRALAARVSPEDGSAEVLLPLAIMTEPQRDAIHARHREALLDRAFTAVERARLAAGGENLRAVTKDALLGTIHALDGLDGAAAIARANDLLDVLETIDAYVPFDVQTAFHRVLERQGMTAAEAAPLAGLARRLGFDVAPASTSDATPASRITA